jgi:hypothetical protein
MAKRRSSSASGGPVVFLAGTASEGSRTASANDVVVFQNYYADGQERTLDPAFTPHDGRHNANTHYREVGLFMRLYHSGAYRAGELTGIVSPKFGEKTFIKGADFIRFIRANPGYDVYFINPFPGNAYYSYNVWDHGELCHEGLMVLAQYLFDLAGIDTDVYSIGRNSHTTLLYANYWVGNEKFWHAFMDISVRLIEAIEKLPIPARARLFALDPVYPDPVPLLPFIFERLFSTLLLIDPTLKGLAYPHSRDAILRSSAGSPDEPIIISSFIELIDEIDARGEYNEQDQAIFQAIGRLKRFLMQDGLRLKPVTEMT